MLLPREGTLLSMTENLGRTLLLVEFQGGQHEFVFEYEVELKHDSASPHNYSGPVNAPSKRLQRIDSSLNINKLTCNQESL
jgi:hypothetical protein